MNEIFSVKLQLPRNQMNVVMIENIDIFHITFKYFEMQLKDHIKP